MTAMELNDELDRQWRNLLSREQSKLIPLYFADPNHEQKQGLLTVGMNPSFAETKIDEFLGSDHNTKGWTRKHFLWAEQSDSRIDLSQAEAAHSAETYARYYKPFWKLRDRLCAPWAHLDLFRYRHMQQSSLKKLLHDNRKFRQAQVDMFKQALNLFNPKLILVANAKASEILEEALPLNSDDETSIHTWKREGKPPLPVFLSGMISSGRMDRYSKQRLFRSIELHWQQL